MALRKSKTELNLTPEDFLSNLDGGGFGNFYVLAGEDYTRAESFLETLRARLVPPGTEDFSLESITVDKEANGAGDIIGAAETIPFLGGFRLVIVRHAEELDAEALEALAAYAEKVAANPRPDMLLVLYMTQLDKRLKFAKTMQKLNVILECEPEPIDDLSEYCRKVYGKTLTPDAERTFTETVGQDRRRVVAEMEKLSLYAAEKEIIEEQDVLAICAESDALDEWALKNCLQSGNIDGVFTALKNLRRDPAGTEEGIFAKLTYILSDLPAAAAAASRGDLRAARIFPGNPHYGAIKRYLSSIDEKKLRKIYTQLGYQMIAFRGSALPKEILDDFLCLTATL